MIITINGDVDGTRSTTTCLLEIHGFLRWCQASAHFVLRIRCQMVRGTIVVTMISRIVVFKMVDDTTIEVNEPGCPSEVGHPIILCHRANPIVRKFKFRFKSTTTRWTLNNHRKASSTSPPGARCPAMRRRRSPPATTCHWSSPALRRDNNI